LQPTAGVATDIPMMFVPVKVGVVKVGVVIGEVTGVQTKPPVFTTWGAMKVGVMKPVLKPVLDGHMVHGWVRAPWQVPPGQRLSETAWPVWPPPCARH